MGYIHLTAKDKQFYSCLYSYQKDISSGYYFQKIKQVASLRTIAMQFESRTQNRQNFKKTQPCALSSATSGAPGAPGERLETTQLFAWHAH